MKLAVFVASDGNIAIKAIYKTKKEDIDYVKMIKELYEKGRIEEIQFSEDVLDKDREIISNMVEEINKASIRKRVKTIKE
jgi:hypothetical protein